MMDTLLVSFHYKPKPDFDFGTHNSFVQNGRADIWGLKMGISYHKRVRFGLGYNFMSSDLTQPLSMPDRGAVFPQVLMHMKMNYGSVYFTYVYFTNKHWEFNIPLQLGIGNSKYVYSYEGTNYTVKSELIILYEPMVETKYYIFPWLGIYLDVGIRLMLKDNPELGKNFNSPMYALGLFLGYGELYNRAAQFVKNR